MKPTSNPGALVAALILALGSACASSVVAADQRAVRDETALLSWRAVTAADLPGQWRTHGLSGPAAAVLLDISYWMDADGRFSGAALFAGPPPAYEVLSGTWTLAPDGALQLGEDSEPARAEVSGNLLRLSGAEGSLILEKVGPR